MISKKINLQNAIITLIVGWLTLFVLVPNLMIIGTSFLTRDEANLIELTFTFDNYLRLLDPLYAKVLMHSFYMAIIATLLCLIIGYPFAYIVAKMPEKWRPFMLFLVIVPFWTNSLIRTYGLKIVLGTQGILNKSLMAMDIIDKPLRLMYTETAVMIGLVYILLPFMILPLYSAIEKLDNTYIEAAKDLGASKLQTITKVILPLTMPGIIGGCLLVLLPALGMFYISDLLGGAKNLLIGNVIKSQVLNARD
ncbi:spermidine/putrescine ABC transporter permease PotB, partial [Vibrio parahaemolyticus]